jgi:hypothetical protein
MEPDGSLPCSQEPATGLKSEAQCNISKQAFFFFYGEEFLPSRPTLKLENHLLSALIIQNNR